MMMMMIIIILSSVMFILWVFGSDIGLLQSATCCQSLKNIRRMPIERLNSDKTLQN